MRNPLVKRIPRELVGDWRKYLVVALFLILTIGFVSGMYVANNSMMIAAEDGKETYKLEDGHFELSVKADSALKSEIEKESEEQSVPVKLYENFFKNVEEDKDCDGTAEGTMRVYAENQQINLASLLEGRYPETKEEIAIDRMHADNAGIRVGDRIKAGGEAYQVVGLIAYVNYSTLHEKNSDLMFDALKFNVAMVTEEGFARLTQELHYGYGWKYVKSPKDESEEKAWSEDLMEVVAKEAVMAGTELKDFLPRYANQAINFAPDDMGSDKAMGEVLLDVLVAIIAFIFAITISNTITKESSTIGTLRALGYTKGELVRHFISTPVIVTLLSALIGNVLGYTLFKNVVVSMYYNSYSLPAYQTVWNADAFWKTTLIPVLLMLAVNLVVICLMMQNTALQFLRHDLKKRKRKKAMRLPRWKFLSRFRLRIIFQNVPNYLVLFVGISFIMIMLAMAIGMPSTLDYYQENASNLMFADYQYVLKNYQDEMGNVIETKAEGAEPFAMKSLQKISEELKEEITVYGVEKDSRYVSISELSDLKEKEVYLSEPFMDKYNLKVGDLVILKEKYEETEYQLKIAGIYEKCQNLAVFMPMKQYRELFDLEENAFTGYFSNTELTDIKEDQIATVITQREITKMCDQLEHSMGSYMSYFQILCILLSTVMIYLLTKIIIEKNENAISMTKILGYLNKEIAGLYLAATTMMVVLANLVGVAVGTRIMKYVWRMVFFEYSGWYAFYMEPLDYVKMFVFVMIGYFVVLYFDFHRIKKVPMDQALKVVE